MPLIAPGAGPPSLPAGVWGRPDRPPAGRERSGSAGSFPQLGLALQSCQGGGCTLISGQAFGRGRMKAEGVVDLGVPLRVRGPGGVWGQGPGGGGEEGAWWGTGGRG